MHGGEPISLQTDLVSVTFDVLVLLALSSRSSGDYAATKSRLRAARRAGRKARSRTTTG